MFVDFKSHFGTPNFLPCCFISDNETIGLPNNKFRTYICTEVGTRKFWQEEFDHYELGPFKGKRSYFKAPYIRLDITNQFVRNIPKEKEKPIGDSRTIHRSLIDYYYGENFHGIWYFLKDVRT